MALIDAVVDSNILIDHLNGISQARATLEDFHEPAISIISWIEVLSGADPEEELATRNFLEQFMTVPVTSEIAEAAVLLRALAQVQASGFHYSCHRAGAWVRSGDEEYEGL